MPFSNTGVEISAIPAIQELTLDPVEPAFRKVLYWEWLITSLSLLLICGGLLFIHGFRHSHWAWITPLAILLLSGFLRLVMEFEFRRLGYLIRQHDLVHRSGWIFQRIRICPYKRVQNCSVHSGPIQRSLGLASITVFTAGEHAADMTVRGLSQENAERIRQYIIARINEEHEA